jgi:orotidine-5'-phosphate decarboxylase
MSSHEIKDRERLIVALDVSSGGEARDLIKTLGSSVTFYKVGLELFLSGDAFELLDWLVELGKKIFVDLKFFDIPETVARAVNQLHGRNVTFATVHGNDTMMRAAAAASNDVGILAVTALTSLDRGDLDDLGFQCDVGELVCSRARRAMEYGCVGVVASGQEIAMLRQHLDESLLIVTPGIRPVINDDDQKRTVTASRALHDGADYIVVGRPIRDAVDPRAVAESLQIDIAMALAR